MNDFDLSDQLNDLVDHETGPQRPAPRFVPVESDDRHPARVWLLVAAVVVVALGVSTAGLTWVTTHRSPPVASPSTATPTATSTPSTSSAYPSASPSTATSAAVSPTGTTPTSTATTLDGMRLVLPAGWTVSRFSAAGVWSEGGSWWCISPPSAAPADPTLDPNEPVSSSACIINLVRYPTSSTAFTDPDGLNGASAENSCNLVPGPGETGSVTSTLDAADTRSFGGRSAEFRKWTHACPSYTVHGEQYSVPTGPAWALYSTVATTTWDGVSASAVMGSIAKNSTLPAQKTSLWLADHGFVTAITKDAGGTTLVIDRYQASPMNQYVITNTTKTSTTYYVPSSVKFWDEDQVKVGSKVAIQTDGTKVTGASLINW